MSAARVATGTAAAVALAATVLALSRAGAQTIDVERPRTLVVGTPAAAHGGGARTDRVDAARTGHAGVLLPAGSLRTEWRTALGVAIEVAPVTDAAGTTYVVGTRGEVIAVSREGSERWRAQEAAQPGPPALLSDDTLVLVDGAGEAIALRQGTLRWRARFGRPDPLHPAPLPLDDGGVVVATSRDLAVLDAEGRERARAVLPEPTHLPLVAAGGKVVVVGDGGTVWTWAPGASEVTRAGSLGGPPDEGAALADERTLVAVTGGHARLSALDLVRGTATTRAAAPGGLWLGPPAMRGATAYVMLLAPTSELAIAVDPAGAEAMRALVATRPAALAADGGAAPLQALPNTPPLVDAAGTLAFATPEGTLGVVSDGGVVDQLPAICPLAPGPGGRPAAAVAALAPLAPGVLVVACRSGTLLAVRAAR